jgi:tetratricopeptide (TPR) repeat protein
VGTLIPFPGQPTTKLGYKRVGLRRHADLERHGQLNLFATPKGEVVELPRNLSTFEEALLLDEHDDPTSGDLYRQAINEGDCIAEAYCNLGILESEAGHRPLAFDCFTLSLANDPRHFESHYNLGNLYLDEGDFRLAKLHYEICTVVEPDFPDTYFNLGLVLVMSEEREHAVHALERYKSLVPDHEGVKADELMASLDQTTQAER